MSGSRPLAHAAQEELELRALELVSHAECRAAQKRVAAYWAQQLPADDYHSECFPREFEQVAFCAAMNVLNADPNYPSIHAFGRFAHRTHGQALPGTKAGHPVADYIYRFAPIDGTAHYVLRGRSDDARPRAFEVGLVNRAQAYLGTLSLQELAIDESGQFEIGIGPETVKRHPNHIRSLPDAHQLIIRDVLGNVATDRPFLLEIERRDAPTSPPSPYSTFVANYESELRKFADSMLSVGKLLATPANTFPAPAFHGSGEHLVTQAYSTGHVYLEPGQALIVTLSLGSSAYATVPITNHWGGIGDFLSHRTALGTGRATPDADGRYTFVVSHQDPGVANWVDTNGLQRGVVIIRWVGFPAGAPGALPQLETRLASLDSLSDGLPEGVAMTSASERDVQLTKHRADYLAALG